MLGGDTGVDRDAGQLFIQFAVRHSVQFHTVYRQIPVVENPNLPGDGGGGHLMITGDHNGADAAPPGVGHRLDGFGPWRVNHGDEADEGKIRFILQGGLTGRVQFPAGEGQHPQAVFREIRVHPENDLPIRLGERTGSLRGEQAGGAGQQHVDGALGHQGGNAIHIVKRAH